MSRQRILLAILTFGALAARGEASPGEILCRVPDCPWRDVTVVRGNDEWVLEGPDHRRVMSIVTEPMRGGHERFLKVTADAEGLVVDAAEAYRRGAVRVVMRAPMPWKKLLGEDCQFVTRWSGEKGVTLRTQVEGADRNGVHWWRDSFSETDGTELVCRQAHLIPGDMRELHWRLDIQKPGAHPVRFRGGQAARWGTFYREETQARPKPELLFQVDFDGSAEASFARGRARPVVMRGLAYAPGRRDRAVCLSAEAKSALAYDVAGNVLAERGTAVAWVRRERRDYDKPHEQPFAPLRQMQHRMLLHLPAGRDEPGRGAFAWRFEWTGLTCCRGDVHDRNVWAFDRPWWGEWEFVAVTWDERGTKLYHNGFPPYEHHRELSPMHTALEPGKPLRFADDRGPFERLFVGTHANGGLVLNGLMDDLRIWSAPLSPDEIRDLYERERDAVVLTDESYGTAGESRTLALKVSSPLGVDLSGARCVLEDAEGRERVSVGAGEDRLPLPELEAGTYRLAVKTGDVRRGSQPYVVLSRGGARSGNAPGELVERIDLGRQKPGPDRFRSTGKTFTGVCDGVPYLCAGTNRGDRLAVRFRLDARVPLYWIEVDYPDDALRTADFLVQPSADPQGYELQVGYATGGAFPTSGRIRTMRLPLWRRADDVSAVLMTIRHGEPAAVSEIRLYKSPAGQLPDAAVRAAPAVNGAQRHVGLYFEDPAVGYDFAQDQMSPDSFAEQIERLVAWLKMSGQDLLAYPGIWYHGRIAEDYQPRPHPSRFLQGYAERFDHEGMSLFPTLNLQALWMPEGSVTRESMSDGSLHPTPVSIHDSGRASWANWHDLPPNFNVAHRALQDEVFAQVDALADELKNHKSFKGVCLHLTSITCTWWGGLENGYNDYCIDGFEKATGIRVPVDRRDPLRARGYAAWLKANALERWLDWRCDVVTRFYAELDAHLKAKRRDLRLWVNAEPTALFAACPDILEPEVVSKRLREYGFDARKLAAAIPDAMLGVTTEPMGWRHHIADRAGQPEAKRRVRDLPTERDFYRAFEVSSYPILNLHDSYFECPSGALRDQISGDWLRECPWRVTVLNAPGRQVLRNYLLPLRFGDMLGVVRGGFLMGGYGTEKEMASFARAFRALPAVRMAEVASRGMVRIRQADWNGRSWFYVVNADARGARVRVRFPEGTTDLSTGNALPADSAALDLEPWDFRSYAAPSGRPELLSESVMTAKGEKATMTIDPSKVLAEVPRTLYGTGMEDVNHEICGGLDAQRLYDESFEEQEIEPVAGLGIRPKPTWVCGRQWKASVTADGRVTADRRDPHLGAVAVALEPGKGSAAVANAGLNGWGVPCRAGRRMQGRFFAKGEVGSLSVSLRRRDGGQACATSAVTLQKTNDWQCVDFSLVPDATDPAAEFVICAAGGGRVLIDDAYLADEATNEFGRIGCREDIVEGFRREGLTFLRWGGSMANSWGYLWKNMKDDRRPYDGFWFRTSSTGFLFKEFVRMADRMKLPCAFSIYAYEQVAKTVEIAEWLKQFDGDIYVQIGNEECAGCTPTCGEFTMGDCRRYCESLRLIVTEMRKVNPRLKFVSALMYNSKHQDVMDEGFRLTDGYVDYWDMHLQLFGPDVTKVVNDTRTEFNAFRDMVRRLNPQTKMKLAIFEENGSEHGLRRALVHAGVLGICREQGDFLLTSCPANALQPYRQNDNGWDQGQIFFTPDKVWLQPCAWAQQMASENHRDLLVRSETGDARILLSSTMSRDGRSIVLHLVNADRQAKPISLFFSDGSAWKVTAVTTLNGDGPLADNVPEAMSRVVPQDRTEEFLRTAQLPACSYTVIVCERSDTGLL